MTHTTTAQVTESNDVTLRRSNCHHRYAGAVSCCMDCYNSHGPCVDQGNCDRCHRASLSSVPAEDVCDKCFPELHSEKKSGQP